MINYSNSRDYTLKGVSSFSAVDVPMLGETTRFSAKSVGITIMVNDSRCVSTAFERKIQTTINYVRNAGSTTMIKNTQDVRHALKKLNGVGQERRDGPQEEGRVVRSSLD